MTRHSHGELGSCAVKLAFHDTDTVGVGLRREDPREEIARIVRKDV